MWIKHNAFTDENNMTVIFTSKNDHGYIINPAFLSESDMVLYFIGAYYNK